MKQYNFSGRAITQFHHNKMEVSVIDKCDSEDCYSLNLSYDNDIDLINHMKESYVCEQSIEVCKLQSYKLGIEILNHKIIFPVYMFLFCFINVWILD